MEIPPPVSRAAPTPSLVPALSPEDQQPPQPCFACESSYRLVVLMPCRHQRICALCWDKERHLRVSPVARCPECRQPVTHAIVPFRG